MNRSEVIGATWLYQLKMPNGDTLLLAAASTNEAKRIAAGLQECRVDQVVGLRMAMKDTVYQANLRKTKIFTLRHKASHLKEEYQTGAALEADRNDIETGVQERKERRTPRRSKARTVAK